MSTLAATTCEYVTHRQFHHTAFTRLGVDVYYLHELVSSECIQSWLQPANPLRPSLPFSYYLRVLVIQHDLVHVSALQLQLARLYKQPNAFPSKTCSSILRFCGAWEEKKEAWVRCPQLREFCVRRTCAGSCCEPLWTKENAR